MVRLIVLDWEELYWDVFELARKIKRDKFKPDILIAIARGGWVIGRILSDLLEVSEVGGLTIRFYKGVEETMNKPAIVQPLVQDIRGKKVLLVDDIVDTGETLRLALEHVSGKGAEVIKSAAPYVKKWSPIRPDYFVKVLEGWVVFPYEYTETIKALEEKITSIEDLKKLGMKKEIVDKIKELKEQAI